MGGAMPGVKMQDVGNILGINSPRRGWDREGIKAGWRVKVRTYMRHKLHLTPDQIETIWEGFEKGDSHARKLINDIDRDMRFS